MKLGKWFVTKHGSPFIAIKKVKGKFLGFNIYELPSKDGVEFAEASTQRVKSYKEIVDKNTITRYNKTIIKYIFEHEKVWTAEEFFSGKFLR